MKLLGFNEYNKSSDKLFEMASELTKLGVSKDLMRFIHKLTGKYQGMTGQMFNTRQEPMKSQKGPYPAREDIPLSHDVQVRGVKKGRRQISHYLIKVITSKEDTGVKLILVNTNAGEAHYITRKTGKLSGPELDEIGIPRGAEGREMARSRGISQKLGLYMRTVAVDIDSGLVQAGWEGTIGQMEKDMDEDSVLYIMEDEDRVRTKRGTRTKQRNITEDQFVDYFVNNYTKILDTQGAANQERINQLLIQKLSGLTADDIASVLDQDHYRSKEVRLRRGSGDSAEKLREIIDLKKAIQNEVISEGNIKNKLHRFLELAFKEGEYDSDEKDRNKASLTDMADKHTMPIVASMFLQYVALGKVYKKFFTDDPFRELGLEDLLL